MANAAILVKSSGEGYKYSVKFCICGILSGGGHGKAFGVVGKVRGEEHPHEPGDGTRLIRVQKRMDIL